MGARDISVSTPGGKATLSEGFTVYPALLAGFAVDKITVIVGENVTFTNTSDGGAPPRSYEWDFDGNGSWDSTAQSPAHTYSAAGTYTVVLRVSDLASNSVTEAREACVTVNGALDADFIADRTAAVVNQTIQFTDGSGGGIPPRSYQWDFGDSENSNAQNPSHAYASAGTYTVVLQVTDSAANTDTETKTGYIRVSGALDADLMADRTAVVVGQPIQFSDTSGGGAAPLSYEWDFGDSGTSAAQDPSHAYLSTGTYNVVLQVTDSAGNSDTETRTGYITVFAHLEAAFAADDTVVTVGQNVNFANGSSGGVAPLSYLWGFGDSGTSIEEDPSHSYASVGRYTVVLEVNDSAGNSDTMTRAGHVTVVQGCDETSSSAGTGTIEVCTSAGFLQNLAGVPESSVPEGGKPALIFSHGLLSFRVTGLSNGQSVTLTISLPSAAPTTTQYWKYGPTPAAPGGEWYSIPMGSNDGDNVITITLRDGGLGDDDLTANGSIVDQGGPGTPRPPEPAPAFPSIYAGITVALGAGVVAYLIRRRLTNP